MKNQCTTDSGILATTQIIDNFGKKNVKIPLLFFSYFSFVFLTQKFLQKIFRNFPKSRKTFELRSLKQKLNSRFFLKCEVKILQNGNENKNEKSKFFKNENKSEK